MKEIMIRFTPNELAYQRPTDVIESYVKLTNIGLSMSARFYCDVPKDKEDLNMGWENTFVCFQTFAVKRNITSIEYAYSADPSRWGIYISVLGGNDYIRFFYKSETKCKEAYDIIYKWLIKKPWYIQILHYFYIK